MEISTFVTIINGKLNNGKVDENLLRRFCSLRTFKKGDCFDCIKKFTEDYLSCVIKGLVAIYQDCQNNLFDNTCVRRVLLEGDLYYPIEGDKIECLENVTIITIEKGNLSKIILGSDLFNQAYIHVIKGLIVENVKVIQAFSTYNSEDRLRMFYLNNVSLFCRLPNRVLAAYLKMSPETCCRYKKKLLKGG